MRYLFCLIFSLQLFAAIPAAAQSGNVIAEIKEQAKFRKQMLALIVSGDLSTRLAALERALDGDDQEMRISARQAAFASKEERLRRVALRHVLNKSGTLQIQYDLPRRASDAQRAVYDRFQASVLTNLSVDPASDRITVSNDFWSGRLVRGGLLMTFRKRRNHSAPFHCTLVLKVVSADLMAGRADCLIKDYNTLRRIKGSKRAILAARVEF